MYIKNGFVCGGKPTETLKVTRVKPLPDRMMLLWFNNGEERLLDTMLLTGPVYKPLENDNIFFHPEIDHGIVTWDHGKIDCGPEYMYDHSYEYTSTEIA